MGLADTNTCSCNNTGAHFNMPGHALADLRVAVIEQTRGKSSAYRKEREH